MARVTLTQRYADLDNWEGRLLEAGDTTTFNARTATSFAFTYGGTHDFAGFKVVVTGTGFGYLSGTPVKGTMTKVVIQNAAGQDVITIDNFGNKLASDLAQFASNIFGSRVDGNGPSPDGAAAWSHLLAGGDVINGTSGNDDRILTGLNAGNDVFNMGAGDDRVGGSMGRDTIHGGDGYDWLTFRETTYQGASATRGISVNTAAGTLVDAWGSTDTFTGIDAFEGSRFNDVFTGNSARNEFSGLRGADTLNGGGDEDRASYGNDYWQGGRFGIVADLETSVVNGKIHGTIRDGFGNTDKTIDIERISGTRFADTFVGSSVRNSFSGGEGKDSYKGMGGKDVLDLGRYFGDGTQVAAVVNLKLASNQIVNDGFGNAETATSIEDIWATEKSDRLTGTTGANWFIGRDGSDTITGGGGADSFEWYDQSQFGDNDKITDFTASGTESNIDVLAFEVASFTNMTETSTLINAANANSAAGVGQFVFDAATDLLYWDSNGSSDGGKMKIVELTGVASLGAQNFDLF